jgi:hypothetical protein
MLIKIDLDPSIVKKIEQFITQGIYSDIRQFVNVAVSNQLEEEISRIKGSKTHMDKLSSEVELTPKLLIEAQGNSQKLTYETVAPLGFGWRKQLQNLPLENSEIQPKTSDLIWYFYNRFFPVKLVIHQLAQIMVTHQKNWIELGDLQVQSFEFAEGVATKLKNIEISAKMARNKKLSTGLPTSNIELSGLRGTVKRKKEDKRLRGRTRFMDQIVGKYVPKDGTFSGACFDLGLMGIQQRDETTYVSLTETGKQLALLENPILDKELFESAFSDREVHFIFHQIYNRFRLENKIIRKIIEWLKKESLTSSQIDQVFKNERRKSFTVERIATMGRLSELQIVNWEIDSKGKSKYSLNQEKFEFLN